MQLQHELALPAALRSGAQGERGYKRWRRAVGHTVCGVRRHVPFETPASTIIPLGSD